MNLLIMGGTEFVSQSMAEYFVEKSYDVSILTRGTSDKTVAGVTHHFKADRKNPSDLKQLENYSFDYIIDINAYTKEDVELLINHIDKSQLKRYVFCSTGGVYLQSSHVLTEDDPVGHNELLGTYGINKLEAENYLRSLYESEGFPACMFRPTYIYGELNNIYREAYFFDKISQRQVIPVPQSSNQMQFLHIEDLVKFAESLLTNDKVIGQSYNITNDDFITFDDIIEISEKVVGKKAELVKINDKDIVSTSYFPFYDMPYMLSIDKLKRDGLHIPKYDLYQGLKRTYAWYKEEKPKNLKHRMDNLDMVINLYT